MLEPNSAAHPGSSNSLLHLSSPSYNHFATCSQASQLRRRNLSLKISPFTASIPPVAHTKRVSTRILIVTSLLASAYNNLKFLYMQSLLTIFKFFFVTKLTTLKMVMKFLRWWYSPNFNHVLKLKISANFVTLQVISIIIEIMLHFFNKLLVKWFGDGNQRQISCVFNCMDIVYKTLSITLLEANSKYGLQIVLSYTSLTGWTWIKFHDTNCIISILNVEYLSSVWLKWNNGYIAP